MKVSRRLPCLPYLETHLVDHCNLNCIGCSHFSTIADEHFTDINDFKRNFKMLSKRLRFNRIRLLGGEPLLHPELPEFVKTARECFPRARLFICTNGLLLPTLKPEVWDILQQCNCKINLSKYPPNKDKIPQYMKLLKSKGLAPKWIHNGENMWVWHNQAGNSDKSAAFKTCAIRHYRVIILREDRLCVCPKAAYADIYNDYFNKNLPRDKGMSIFRSSGKQLAEYVTKPIETCKFCTYGCRPVPWKQSEHLDSEWNFVNDERLLTVVQKKLYQINVLGIKPKRHSENQENK